MEDLKIISKTNNHRFIAIKTIKYLATMLLMILIIFLETRIVQEDQNIISIFTFTLFLSFLIPYALLFLGLSGKIRRSITNNKESVDSLKLFIKNWEKTSQLKEFKISNTYDLGKTFHRKQKYINLYLKRINTIVYLNKHKDPDDYSDKDWNKYLYLFSRYLSVAYILFNKKKKDEDEQIKLIVNHFLNNTL